MGTEKRERQKAQRAAKLEAERAAQKRQQMIKTIRNVVIFALVIVVVAIALSSCSKSDGGDAQAKVTDGKGCPTEAAQARNKLDFTKAPPLCLDKGKTYTAVVRTTEGTVKVRLDTTKTPKTANNFVVLSRWGYYDDTALFRTEAATGIIQGGSPHTNTNTDTGPGYTIPDEGKPWPSSAYGPGTLAMANTGQPNSGGAQFFFLAGTGGEYLGDPAKVGSTAGSYTVFGKTVEGQKVLEKIAQLDNGSGSPKKDVRIESIRIVES